MEAQSICTVGCVPIPVPVPSPPDSTGNATPSESASTSARPRLHAVDAVRGFCLLNIFVNHISAGVLNRASPSNLGLSDSADVFVLLAGFAACLGSGDRRFQDSVAHLWSRAVSLYLHNLVLIGASLVSLAAIGLAVGTNVLVEGGVLVSLASADIATAAWSLVSLQQSVGFSMVLRLYVGLMLMAPILIWLARKEWWLPLPIVTVIWLVGAHFDLVARDSLTGVPLTLTVLPWTLIFGLGLALGAAFRQGIPVPRSPILLAGAITVVAGYFVFLVLSQTWPDGQAWLMARNDMFWLGASKTYQSPLRVLHTLSLVYIFISCARAPVLRLVHNVGPDNVFARLGRQSLPVFMTGALIAVPANEIVNLANRHWGALSPPAVIIELTLIGAGIAMMIWIASRRSRRQAPAVSNLDPVLEGPLPVRPASRT